MNSVVVLARGMFGDKCNTNMFPCQMILFADENPPQQQQMQTRQGTIQSTNQVRMDIFLRCFSLFALALKDDGAL